MRQFNLILTRTRFFFILRPLPLAVLLAILLLASCHSPSRNADQSKTTPAAVPHDKLSLTETKADMMILWSAIKELHAGYGMYTPADSIAKCYDTTFAGVGDSLYTGEFIARLYPLLCTLGCGHTQLRFPEGYKPPVSRKTSHLPFEVLVHDQKAWVTTIKTNQLFTGDELISINDEPVASIIRHGYNIYCGDGHITSFKELFLSEYNGFDDVCNGYYGWTFPYRVTVRTTRGELKKLILDSASRTTLTNSAITRKPANWRQKKLAEDLALDFFQNNRIALFKVGSLQYADTTFYGEAFKDIAEKGSKDLILDLRHNGGGDIRIVTKLLSYLADTTFAIVKDIRSRVPDPTINSVSAYFDPERTESFKGSCIPGKQEGGWYHMDIRPEFAHPYGPNPVATSGRFRGRLFVLVDGATFSSTALFTTALRAQRKDVLFIGSETAGTEEGCNGFAMQRLTLPNSRVIVEFPLLRVVSMAASPAPGRGLIPEYQVQYTPEDIVNGNDPDLIKALELIGKRP